MTNEQLRAQLEVLNRLCAEARAAREERTPAWYAAQFNAQQAAIQTQGRCIRPWEQK